MPVSVRRALAALLVGLFLTMGSAVAVAPASAAPSVSGSVVSAAADPVAALAARGARRGTTKVIVIGGGALLVALIAAAVKGRQGRDEDRERR